MYQRSGIEIYITENSSVIIKILILHPCAVAEFMYFYSQKVSFAVFCQIICDIKTMGRVAVLAVANFLAVNVYIVCGFNALE